MASKHAAAREVKVNNGCRPLVHPPPWGGTDLPSSVLHEIHMCCSNVNPNIYTGADTLFILSGRKHSRVPAQTLDGTSVKRYRK
ncbi:hypothetical protein E2C01_004907 [Portunus trituberculatus]|uniref:Uncharacterized protein n=1 Tax=Portunus trituberculatus TaxID=210409 RepID=A0A5B7CQX8_PORTR|nr:hypothetical protein [Portunus trituberculatus]